MGLMRLRGKKPPLFSWSAGNDHARWPQQAIFEAITTPGVVVVQLENDVRESFEVRVHRAVERELDVARVESSLLRIVVADLDVIEVACAGIGEREQAVEGDVHVISAAADSNWLR